MKDSNFREKFLHIFRYAGAAFFILMSLRFAYGYLSFDTEHIGESHTIQSLGQSQQNEFETGKRNYASDKRKANPKEGSISPQFLSGQKYEKVGAMNSTTHEFEKDEKTLRDTVQKFKALIQLEQNTGLAGSRILRLGIGVDPEKFDEMVSAVRKIGNITNIQITKTDKTNEYRDLNAQRLSQEKYRDSLISLKSRNGKISEMIELENRILEIEKEIQNLGVKLGDFDEENEFCTVKFTLAERRSAATPGFFKDTARRLKAAFEWTVKYYLLGAVMLFFASLFILVFLLIIERLNLIREIFLRFRDETVPENKDAALKSPEVPDRKTGKTKKSGL